MGVCTKPVITDAVLRALVWMSFGLSSPPTTRLSWPMAATFWLFWMPWVDKSGPCSLATVKTLCGQSANWPVAVTYGYCHVPFAELDLAVLIDTFGELPTRFPLSRRPNCGSYRRYLAFSRHTVLRDS